MTTTVMMIVIWREGLQSDYVNPAETE